MKKFYIAFLMLIAGASTFAQNGQIQNGGFENWSSPTLFNGLIDWIDSNSDEWQGVAATNQSTDAQDGTYSVELSSEIGPAGDTVFGYVLHGTIGPSGPDGGIPYTDNIDEVRFQYKGDMPVGDTLYLLTIRFNLGVQVGMTLSPAAYGTTASWTQGSVALPVGIQDELFIGFVVGDPFGSVKPTPGAWARIDNVEMFNASTQMTDLPDQSFENWAPTAIENPDDWYTINDQLIGIGVQNATKTTDANSGSFAIELSTIYNSNWDDTVGGFISIGAIDMNSMGSPFSAIPYNASPTNFDYAYKYTGANGDLSGGVLIDFFNSGITIGGAFLPVTDQASYFTGSLTLSYIGTPDSVMIMAYSGDSLGSVLKLDDLAFSGGDVGIDEFSKMDISIYPNPASDVVMVKAEGNYSYRIFDLAGNLVNASDDVVGVQVIDIHALENGSYIVQISDGTSIESHKLIVQ